MARGGLYKHKSVWCFRHTCLVHTHMLRVNRSGGWWPLGNVLPRRDQNLPFQQKHAKGNKLSTASLGTSCSQRAMRVLGILSQVNKLLATWEHLPQWKTWCINSLSRNASKTRAHITELPAEEGTCHLFSGNDSLGVYGVHRVLCIGKNFYVKTEICW